MRLTPCPHCARHLRQDVVVCPFCDQALPSSGSARAKVSAMIVGAVTVSSLAGCPRHATKYGGPPPPSEQPSAVEPEAVEPEAEPEPDEDVTDSPDAQPAESPDASPT